MSCGTGSPACALCDYVVRVASATKAKKIVLELDIALFFPIITYVSIVRRNPNAYNNKARRILWVV